MAIVEPVYRLLSEGEGGLVVELGDVIDPAVNARVHRLADAIRRSSRATSSRSFPRTDRCSCSSIHCGSSERLSS